MKDKYVEIARSVPNSDCIFKYVEVNKDFSFPAWEMNQHVLLFVLDGRLKINYQNKLFQEVISGCFVMIPKNVKWKATALSQTKLMIFSFSKLDNVWSKSKIKTLLDASPKSIDDEPFILSIKTPLAVFLDLMVVYTVEKDIEKSFYAMKENELLSLLYTFYPLADIACMFRPVLQENSDFKSFVLANYLRVDNASELAKLAGCSLVTLNRHFKEIFNDSAYQWMIKNKKSLIQKRLLNPTSSLGDIAREFGFYSGSELNRFCQRQFGVTALALRKQILEDESLKR